MLLTMVNRLCTDGSIVGCEKEQSANIGEFSELAGTLTSPTITLEDNSLQDVTATEAERSETIVAAVMSFNNGHVVTIMEMPVLTSTHIHSIVLPSTNTCTANHSVCYFSSTVEVSVFGH